MTTGTKDGNGMDHAQASERLSGHLDGELDAKEAAAVEVHLATCEACRRELSELRRTVSALSALRGPGVEEGGPDLVSGVVDRVRRRSRGRFFGTDGRKRARLEVMSATMLAILLVVYVVLHFARPAVLHLK